MLIPIIGEFFAAVGLILCTYYPVPMEVAGITGNPLSTAFNFDI